MSKILNPELFIDVVSDKDIDTYGIKYIGSKKKLLPFIGEAIKDLNISTAVDVFTGTTRVAQYLRQKGIQCDTSDLSWAATSYAYSYVHNKDNAHLLTYINEMNALPGVDGWLTENYTGTVDESLQRGEGRCFRPKNTRRADSARDYVDTLTSLDHWEKSTLITSIIKALDSVDNTVGVQQAYLKEWCERSNNDIKFELPKCINGPIGMHYEGSCLVNSYRTVDLAYLDPPYSPHQYSTYYHIWDSVARWDKPQTSLKSKRRIDRVAKQPECDASMTSPWNSKNTAGQAFSDLINRLPARYILISYSNESIMPEKELMDICQSFGKTSISYIDYRRNIMSQIGNAGKDADKKQTNQEWLVLIDKEST